MLDVSTAGILAILALLPDKRALANAHDSALLQGTWVAVAYRLNGKEWHDSASTQILVIEGERLDHPFFSLLGRSWFEINATASPKEMEMYYAQNPFNKYRFQYQVTSEYLKIACEDKGDSWPLRNSGDYLLFKRELKKPSPVKSK